LPGWRRLRAAEAAGWGRRRLSDSLRRGIRKSKWKARLRGRIVRSGRTMASIRSYSLLEIAEAVGGRVVGDAGTVITGVNSVDQAGPGQITWISDERFARRAASSRAGAFLTRPEWLPEGRSGVVVDRPEVAIIRVLEMFAEPPERPAAGVHPTAVVAESARLGEGVCVGPNAVISDEVEIGDGTVIHAGVFIGRGVRIGTGCVLWPNVVVRERCIIGDRVVIHPNATIGADGFGYQFVDGKHLKIPQIGNVVIEDDVEIGAGACIDRAKFGSTVIGAGAKIDNLVQVGHNVKVGRGCILVAQVGIGGSAEVGPYSVLGGKAGIRDHVRLGSQVRVAACCCVPSDLSDGVEVAGVPAVEARQWKRQQAALHRLPRLLEQMRALAGQVADLAKRVARLESAGDHSQGC